MEDGWEDEEPEYNYYVEKDEDGYFAFCPELDGCFTQGDSEKEVIKNIEDAIFLHLQDRGISTDNVSRIKKRTKKKIVIKKPDNDESLN